MGDGTDSNLFRLAGFVSSLGSFIGLRLLRSVADLVSVEPQSQLSGPVLSFFLQQFEAGLCSCTLLSILFCALDRGP